MIVKGDRVRHRNNKESFGLGTVLDINHDSNHVRVEWDSYNSTVKGDTIIKFVSNVVYTSLSKLK